MITVSVSETHLCVLNRARNISGRNQAKFVLQFAKHAFNR
ncbi:hypothetical protein E2C01_079526 [Portunus trituberculatus]|uniref:Uncharacterized protein n=1 Tax=Portunus trituberculatus TaxID=210409 RepID=A0A5B7ITK4_PORTR|nr:hypothetical protein [Portunus trituberculatus]